MSHRLYNCQWHSAQLGLSDLLEVEMPKEPPKPEKDKIAAFQKFATMYIKYVLTFRKLEECYDQVTHPQKRRTIRHVLDGTIGRILELKHEMVNLELLEFHYFDDILTDMKLTPGDVELPIPHYFTSENSKLLKERDKLLGSILAKMGPQDSAETKEDSTLTTDEAVRLIQIHERARQGRLRAKFMKEIRHQEERERQAQLRGPPKIDPDVAATSVQKVWRGFSQRKKIVALREEELEFIGMVEPKPTTSAQKKTPVTFAKKTEEKRRLTQEHYEKDFNEALVSVKDKLADTEGPDMKEQMQDQIRQWFIETRDATGKFPEFPDADEGGSEAIFKKREELVEDEDEGGKGKKGKKGKAKKEKKGKKKGKKGKGDEEEEQGTKMAPSNFVPTIKEGSEIYASVWKDRDETANPMQKYDVELIKDDKRVELEGEIRVQVDELMREELNNLKMAVERDKGKGKAKGKKGKKGKKAKKGKKGKKEKDLTPDRTIDSLYEELAQQGVIVRCPKVRISEFVGEYSYLGTTLRQAGLEPMPSLADVRRVITEHCILPLGSQVVHEKAPHVKSVMIAGPRGVGKKMLAHAVCTETGANMFDLTPANIATKYPGKAGLNMLLHMVFKVAKAWPPSVVYIGECERTWMKKVPKNDKADPKRVKKHLPKIIKGMKQEDRVLILGVTKSPYDGEVKGLCGIYQRIILVPRPDYASRIALWKAIVGGHATSLDISSLAKITDGYTPGHIATAVSAVLSERRIQQLRRRPLTAAEFVAPLSKIDPIYKEEEEAYKAWYEKTPLGRKRARAVKGGDDDGGGKKGKKGKGKKKGK